MVLPYLSPPRTEMLSTAEVQPDAGQPVRRLGTAGSPGKPGAVAEEGGRTLFSGFFAPN